MTTITLDNKIGADVIEAIKALLADKPKELYSIDDDEYLSEAEGISEADKAELIETYELAKAGKMEWMSEDEVRESLAKRGYEW